MFRHPTCVSSDVFELCRGLCQHIIKMNVFSLTGVCRWNIKWSVYSLGNEIGLMDEIFSCGHLTFSHMHSCTYTVRLNESESGYICILC